MTPPSYAKYLSLRSLHVLRQAKRLADASDQLFVSVASSVTRLGWWQPGESLHARPKLERRALLPLSGTAHRPRGASGQHSRSAGGECQDPARGCSQGDVCSRRAESPPPSSDLDLLVASSAVAPCASPAAPCSEAGQELQETTLEGERGQSPAGLTPLLQALGRIMSEHRTDRYAALAEDSRFWTLVHLLEKLGGPGSTLLTLPRGNPDRTKG